MIHPAVKGKGRARVPTEIKKEERREGEMKILYRSSVGYEERLAERKRARGARAGSSSIWHTF